MASDSNGSDTHDTSGDPAGTSGDPAATEILAPDGVASGGSTAGSGERSSGAVSTAEQSDDEDSEVPDVGSPAKIIRIGAMVKQLLDELREIELDEHSRDQLRDIYSNSVTELKTAVSPELADELDSLSFAFDDDDLPSAVELRMAKAQLVGWLEGLFHGMQAAMMAQQMSMRAQGEGMRPQLPEAGGSAHGGGPGYL